MLNSLTSRTVDRIKDKITEESLGPGDKLPTLNQMATELGVSRTVVREAVITLSSEGMLETKHGVGVFVKGQEPEAAQPISLADAILSPLTRFKASFMDLLELRMAFEVHAAGLAAARRSWGQEASIWEAAQGLEQALDNLVKLDEYDYAFHRAVAEATNNAAFVEFFALMSPRMMPPAFSRTINPSLLTPEYLQQTVNEHRAVCEAISAGDPARAQEAMRAHIQRGHQRYRDFQPAPESA